MHQNKAVVIASISRTPIGNFQGCLSTFQAMELGAMVIKSAVQRAGIPIDCIDEVLMGCVLTAGQGQAPARQAAIKAGLPASVACTTINKMCGSGMKSIMSAYDLIKSGGADIVVAGGMESMSNAPYVVPKVRQGLKVGHAEILDHLFIDGLEDPDQQRLMGCYAEECAGKFKFSREQQDQFARQSLLRAKTAIAEGIFDQEIVPVETRIGNKEIQLIHDEHPLTVDIDKIGQLKAVFKQGGTVTAANSSSISDGAAAVVLMSDSLARHYHVKPLAQIIAHQSYAQSPALFTSSPLFAIVKLLEKLYLSVDDIDLYEINEAFAVVALAVIKTLELSEDKVNIHGGACALGHPIGASGARILVTLLAALQRHHLKRGLASICIAGGEATAMVIER